MHQHTTQFTIHTSGKALVEITAPVAQWIASIEIGTGLLTLFCRHTSASLLITENAAPAVKRDLLRWLDRLAPESAAYEHDDEGPDDMPAHLRAALTGNSLTIPVVSGQMVLGTWQGIHLAEHRAIPHQRQIVAHLLSE